MRLRSTGPLVIGAALLVGCLPEPAPPIGDPIGDYQVTAALEQSSCGELLGFGATWMFRVSLRRGGGMLYWDNGTEVVEGPLSSDETGFAISTEVLFEVQRPDPEENRPECTIVRGDWAEATLDAPAESATSFEGAIGFRYELTETSVCGELASEEPVLYEIPCSARYAMQAERIDRPAEPEPTGD